MRTLPDRFKSRRKRENIDNFRWSEASIAQRTSPIRTWANCKEVSRLGQQNVMRCEGKITISWNTFLLLPEPHKGRDPLLHSLRGKWWGEARQLVSGRLDTSSSDKFSSTSPLSFSRAAGQCLHCLWAALCAFSPFIWSPPPSLPATYSWGVPNLSVSTLDTWRARRHLRGLSSPIPHVGGIKCI